MIEINETPRHYNPAPARGFRALAVLGNLGFVQHLDGSISVRIMSSIKDIVSEAKGSR